VAEWKKPTENEMSRNQQVVNMPYLIYGRTEKPTENENGMRQ